MSKPKGPAMITRRNALSLALVPPLLAATGCGVGAARQRAYTTDLRGKLSLYGWQATDEVGQAREGYAAHQLSHIPITYDRANFDPQKFTALLASGRVPDIVVMMRTFIGTYAAKGLIRPLDEAFDMAGFDPRAHYYPATLDDVTMDGKIYGIPQFWQPFALLLNKRVMERSGVTDEDMDLSDTERFLDAVRKMYRGRHGKPQTLGLYPSITDSMPDWITAFDGRLMDESGRPTLDDPGVVAAVRFLKSVYDVQGGYAVVESYFQSFDQFGNGNQYVRDQVGAQLYAQWYPNVLSATAKKVSIMATPLRDRSGNPFACSQGTAFVVPKTAPNPSAAVAWARAVTSDSAWLAAGVARAKTVHDTPGGINTGLFTGARSADDLVRRKYVKPSGNADFDQVIQAYYQVVRHGRSIGASAAGLAIRRELANAVVQAFTGSKPVADALHDAQTAALYGYDKV